MSVCSDQSASCSSLHGALPHPHNQMQTGGNIINTTAWTSADRSIIHLWGLSRPSPHSTVKLPAELKWTRELTPVQTSWFLHSQKNFHTDKRNPWAPFSHGRKWKTCFVYKVMSVQFIEKIVYVRSSCSHWNHKIVSIKLQESAHFSIAREKNDKQ